MKTDKSPKQPSSHVLRTIAVFLTLAASSGIQALGSQPNVLLIMADDLGAENLF